MLNLGDAAVHPLHLEQPSWQNGFDLAADRALATRRQLMERAMADDMHVMAFHFPFPSIGRVAGEKRRLDVDTGLVTLGRLQSAGGYAL